jgi:hypothetical protein
MPSQPSPVPEPGCPTCGEGTGAFWPPAYVYAIGKIEPRIPQLSVEKEFAQATGRSDTIALTDREVLQKLLVQREYRYLARQLCWTMTVEGLDTYIVIPREQADLEFLIATLRSISMWSSGKRDLLRHPRFAMA